METKDSLTLYVQVPHIPIDKICDKNKYDYYKIHSLRSRGVTGGRIENQEGGQGKKTEEEKKNEDTQYDVNEPSKANEQNISINEFKTREKDKNDNQNYEENEKENNHDILFDKSDEECEDEKTKYMFLSFFKNKNKNPNVKSYKNSDPQKISNLNNIYNIEKNSNSERKEEKKKKRNNVHLFETVPNIPIKEEFFDKWFHFVPLKSFEVVNVDIPEFMQKCENVRKRLKIKSCPMDVKNGDETKDIIGRKENEEKTDNEHLNEDKTYLSQESIEEKRNIKEKFYDYLIKILMSGIRAPTVEEIIYNIVYYNCCNWQNKINTNVLQYSKNLRNQRPPINRKKCYLNWVPKTEDNEYNKYNIIALLKSKTISKTFKLVCDFNNTKLKSMFINQNLINSMYLSGNKYHVYSNSSTNLSSDCLCVISVSFYQPVRGIKIAEFDILSTQTLADLTDSFLCIDCLNYGIPRFEGSVYYIDGILYPDLRKREALDYSRNIINFYSNIKNEKFLKYPYKIQQDKAVLGKIKIPLFKKCCFLHQGNCEHRIVFSNVRQYNSFRDKEISQYPLQTFKPNVITRVCVCCRINTAEKIVLDCFLLKENPSYLCDSCFKLFLFDEKDEPVDQTMKFFDYVQNA